MENINDQMQEFLVEQPFAYTELTKTMNCEKEAIDLGAVPNEEVIV